MTHLRYYTFISWLYDLYVSVIDSVDGTLNRGSVCKDIMSTGTLTDALKETLEVFDDSGEPLTTTEVADELDLGRRSTYGRLDRLVERDALKTKSVGANARVWWQEPTVPTSGNNLLENNGNPGTNENSQFSLLVNAVEEYAIFMLDPEGYVQTWNEGARKIKGYDSDEIVDEHFSTFYATEDQEAGIPTRNLTEAVKQGYIEDEGWRVRNDGSCFWASVTITTLYDDDGEHQGFAKVTRDMTDRREQENAIRKERDLVEQIFEISPVGIGVLSRKGLERMNTQAAEIYGEPTMETDNYTIGKPEVFDSDGNPVPPENRPNARVFETGESVSGWECQLEGADGQRRWLSVSAAPLTDEDGEVEYVVVATEDISSLKEHARRLEQERDKLEQELDEVFERIDEAFCAFDSEFRFTYVNERASDFLQVEAGNLLGKSIWELYPETIKSRIWEGLHKAMETQEPTKFETYVEAADSWLMVSVYPSETGLSVYFLDITKRKERELQLERYETVLETIEEGVYIVNPEGYLKMVNNGFSQITGYSKEELTGMHASKLVDEETLKQAKSYEQELVAGERKTARFEADVQRANGGTIRGDGSFSLIESQAEEYERIGVVRDVTERRRREQEVRRQRERLAALNHLNAVVRELTRAAIVQSTRNEIEKSVCEGLTASDSYQYASISEFNHNRQSLEIRAEARTGDFPSDNTVIAYSSDHWSVELARQAFDSRKVQVINNIPQNDDHRELQNWADGKGVRSVAVIPIVHEEVVFGVLLICSDRELAYSGREREIIGHLGDVVGHAVAAADQRRALMSDEYIELAFQLNGFGDKLGIDAPDGGRVELSQTVPLGDGEHLVYGTVNEAGIDILESVVSVVPHWVDVEFYNDTEHSFRFQARLVKPPVLATITAIGGRVEELVLENGNINLVVHLLPGTDVRPVIDKIREQYPTAELVSRRQITQSSNDVGMKLKEAEESLTDQQQNILVAAFNSGYFNQPRTSSGKEIAESLNIAPATFHEHLRSALRKTTAAMVEK